MKSIYIFVGLFTFATISFAQNSRQEAPIAYVEVVGSQATTGPAQGIGADKDYGFGVAVGIEPFFGAKAPGRVLQSLLRKVGLRADATYYPQFDHQADSNLEYGAHASVSAGVYVPVDIAKKITAEAGANYRNSSLTNGVENFSVSSGTYQLRVLYLTQRRSGLFVSYEKNFTGTPYRSLAGGYRIRWGR